MEVPLAIDVLKDVVKVAEQLYASPWLVDVEHTVNAGLSIKSGGRAECTTLSVVGLLGFADRICMATLSFCCAMVNFWYALLS